MPLAEPFLIFSMQLDNTSALNLGRLVLADRKQGIIQRWVATSGLGQYQKIGGYNKQGGGCLPPTYELSPPLPFYEVNSDPIDLSHVRGVEGPGFVISPYSVTTRQGVTRSDLLIHKDANVPGSMGCIVLPPGDEWDNFQEVFTRQCTGKVPLLVIYTF